MVDENNTKLFPERAWPNTRFGMLVDKILVIQCARLIGLIAVYKVG